MGVNAVSASEGQRIVSDIWPIVVEVTDENGFGVSAVPSVTVTLPDGSMAIPLATATTGGCMRAEYLLSVPGRYVATVFAAGYGATGFAVDAVDVTDAGRLPGLADATSYLGTTSWGPSDIADALSVERAAQRDRCAIPAYYPDSLRGALLRRVARNLGMRVIPLAQPIGDAEGGGPNLPPYDPEINRLEKPHWRVQVA